MSTLRIAELSIFDLIGHCVYSSERHHGGSDDPLGGVIVDAGVGGVSHERFYLTLDHRRLRPDLRIDTIYESEVGDAEESPTQRLRILVRRLCQEVAMDGYKPRTGTMTAREADCVRWAWTLMRAMGGPS